MGEMKKEERGSWADPSALGLFGLAIVTLVACSQNSASPTGRRLSWGGPFSSGMRSAYRRIDRFEEEQRIRRHRVYRLRVVLACHGIRLGDDQRHVRLLCGRNVRSAPNRSRFRGVPHLDCVYDHRSALSAFGVAREATHMLAAISELVISLLSFYCAGANILNNHFGEQFLSLGNPFWSKKS